MSSLFITYLPAQCARVIAVVRLHYTFNMTTKTTIKFQEYDFINLRFQLAPEYLSYKTHLVVKNSGKKPVTLILKFDDMEPLAAPMPPKSHKIQAESISALFPKINKWALKYGYSLQ
jgi:hypothetical protein